MKLHNSLTKTEQEFTPQNNKISIYSCGPTVYNNLTIGNLSAFIYADLLRRVLLVAYPESTITHVMNVTDVDDKTIRDSKVAYQNEDPMQALIKFTRHYEDVFMTDMSKVGNDLSAFSFIRATESIKEMQDLITELYKNNIAYIADDGVYFSIDAYQKAGKTYGQLVELEKSTDTKSRIQNDEYDKDSANDFALWKITKPGEPSWEFSVGGQDFSGRPGWHIECSAMSRKLLGKEFDIHTGGIDLKFPHHENEIAQSTACEDSPVMAKFFIHNDHMLVDGVKMSKSLGNFFTLRDVEEKGYDPLAFRLLVLQGHYSNSVNFSWDNLEAAQSTLSRLKTFAEWRFQIKTTKNVEKKHRSWYFDQPVTAILEALKNDLSTPRAFAVLHNYVGVIENRTNRLIHSDNKKDYDDLILFLDKVFGLGLSNIPDISDEAYKLIENRENAKINKDYLTSDKIRDEFKLKGLFLIDQSDGSTVWTREIQ